MPYETLTSFFDMLLVGLCLFCASLLLVDRRDPGVYLPLGLLFLLRGVSALAFVVPTTLGAVEEVGPAMRLSLALALPEVASPFLFWLYVRALTTEGAPERIPKPLFHILPALVVLLLMASPLLLSTELNAGELPEDHPAMIVGVLVVLAILIGDVLFTLLTGVYLYLTIRRLRAYQTRLKEVFASTENRELRWIWIIMLFAGLYMLASVLVSISLWTGIAVGAPESGLFGALSSAAMLALFWVIGIWGLRQRPGLTRGPVVEPVKPEDPPLQKYEKSALDDARAARIARKIEAAMEQDQLYREPNLSLWDLAKHIGVTSHYVSQTLNAQLQASFFDYINSWRIKDAVAQLTATDETILVIAYDVGFNSRSAFYKAFKRETGKTPSDLRKT